MNLVPVTVTALDTSILLRNVCVQLKLKKCVKLAININNCMFELSVRARK